MCWASDMPLTYEAEPAPPGKASFGELSCMCSEQWQITIFRALGRDK